MKKYLLLPLTAFIFLLSCIEQVEQPYRNEEPILVVEGGITNETPPYTLKLSYSGKFLAGNTISSNLAVNGARVTVISDKGDSVKFEQNLYQAALYQTDLSYQGQAGRSYSLRIEMPDGKIYKTAPQLMKPVPAITNVSADKIDDFVRFYLDTSDPENSTDYYQWKGYSISFKITEAVTVASFSSSSISNALNSGCHSYCWAYNNLDVANVFADTYINGKSIKKRLVLYSPIEKDAINSQHFAEIKQLSISREAYVFWQQYEEQRTRTGSIFDPLPATIIGNVVNAANDKDFALGFFEVSAVSTKRFLADPRSLVFSKEPNKDILPPPVNNTRPKADCDIYYPLYGCTPPSNWK